MTDRSARGVLHERARRLAAPLADVARASVEQNTLVFRRAGDTFGLPLDVVVEVQRGPALAPLPKAAAPVIGVIGWRGRILTVIDTATTAPDTSDPDREWRAIIVGESRARIVIYADAVDDARDVRDDDWRALDDKAVVAPTRVPVRGITADAVVLIDGAALLERYAG